MTDADKTRDRRYKERQREKGLVQVLVWVPAGAAEGLRDIAHRMRNPRGCGSPEGSDFTSPPSGNTGGITPLEKHIKDQSEQ